MFDKMLSRAELNGKSISDLKDLVKRWKIRKGSIRASQDSKAEMINLVLEWQRNQVRRAELYIKVEVEA